MTPSPAVVGVETHSSVPTIHKPSLQDSTLTMVDSNAADSFKSPAEPRATLMQVSHFRSPSLVEKEEGSASSLSSTLFLDPRRRSWVVAMDKVRKERREEASRANADRTDEEIANHEELRLPSDALVDQSSSSGMEELTRPALRLRPQRRDSTVFCLACGRPVCQTPRRFLSVTPKTHDGGSEFCCCRAIRSSNSDDELLRPDAAGQEVLLSPSTSDRFVLEPPNDTLVGRDDLGSSSSDDEEHAGEESSSHLVFRPRILLKPRDEAIHRSLSDPLTSPTPAIPMAVEEQPVQEETSQSTIPSLPLPPIYTFDSDVVQPRLNGAPRDELGQYSNPEALQTSGLQRQYTGPSTFRPSSQISSIKNARRHLKPRLASAPISGKAEAPLLPLNTPENLRSTISLTRFQTLADQAHMEPPTFMPHAEGIPSIGDMYETPNQPRRKFRPGRGTRSPPQGHASNLHITNLNLADSNNSSAA